MPITQSAKKTLARSYKRRLVNLRLKKQIKESLKKARKSQTPKTLAQAASALDKAVKKRYLHKNKAARLKSRLAKISRQTQKQVKSTTKKVKTTTKKVKSDAKTRK